jgi:hypothetical protein
MRVPSIEQVGKSRRMFRTTFKRTVNTQSDLGLRDRYSGFKRWKPVGVFNPKVSLSEVFPVGHFIATNRESTLASLGEPLIIRNGLSPALYLGIGRPALRAIPTAAHC